REDPRHRQAPARLRHAPADGLLPAAGGRGADGGADRDRDTGDARLLRRGDRGDSRRGRGGSRHRPERAVHDPGPPPRRGRSEPQSGRAPAALARELTTPGRVEYFGLTQPGRGSSAVFVRRTRLLGSALALALLVAT